MNIDFDKEHPGPRLWDIVYALYKWVPLTNSSNTLDFRTTEDKLKRKEIFLDSYEYEDYQLND